MEGDQVTDNQNDRGIVGTQYFKKSYYPGIKQAIRTLKDEEGESSKDQSFENLPRSRRIKFCYW